MRKKRSDRNHLIYQLSIRNMHYIGVTVVENGRVDYSLKRRFQKHVCRAYQEDLNWKLCEAIRKYGPDQFALCVLKVVRGKSAAHHTERLFIDRLHPVLNSDVRKVKNAN